MEESCVSTCLVGVKRFSSGEAIKRAIHRVGAKIDWFLKSGYGDQVPEPSSRFEACLGEIDAVRSSFAHRDEFYGAVNVYLDEPESLTGPLATGYRERSGPGGITSKSPLLLL